MPLQLPLRLPFRRSLRFLCPTCHGSIDPLRVETGGDGSHDYCICPECDGVFPVTLAGGGAERGAENAAESLVAAAVERSPALPTRLRRTLIRRQSRRLDWPR